MTDAAIHEQNRRSWNNATNAHNQHKKDVAAFLRDGGSTLFPEEVELLGNISGKNVLHLCCNVGEDSLSLAQRGAVVTGVDISDVAIDIAVKTSKESGIPARFFRSDVYEWLAKNQEKYDVVFFSYGVIGWLTDLPRFFEEIANCLAPQGRLVMIEFHPLIWSLRDDGLTGDDYFATKPFHDPVSNYVAQSGEGLTPMGFLAESSEFKNPEMATSFQWTIADLVTWVSRAGFRIYDFREWPYSNGYRAFPAMRLQAGRRYGLPEGWPTVPLMVGLMAALDTKQG